MSPVDQRKEMLLLYCKTQGPWVFSPKSLALCCSSPWAEVRLSSLFFPVVHMHTHVHLLCNNSHDKTAGDLKAHLDK